MVYGLWSMVYGLWFMVYGVWCMVYREKFLWFMVYGLWCMVYGAWFMVNGVWFMVYGVWCMVYGLWFMVYGVWCMVYGAWFMVYGIWFMVYGVWFMVYGLAHGPACVYLESPEAMLLLFYGFNGIESRLTRPLELLVEIHRNLRTVCVALRGVFARLRTKLVWSLLSRCACVPGGDGEGDKGITAAAAGVRGHARHIHPPLLLHITCRGGGRRPGSPDESSSQRMSRRRRRRLLPFRRVHKDHDAAKGHGTHINTLRRVGIAFAPNPASASLAPTAIA